MNTLCPISDVNLRSENYLVNLDCQIEWANYCGFDFYFGRLHHIPWIDFPNVTRLSHILCWICIIHSNEMVDICLALGHTYAGPRTCSRSWDALWVDRNMFCRTIQPFQSFVQVTCFSLSAIKSLSEVYWAVVLELNGAVAHLLPRAASCKYRIFFILRGILQPIFE